MRLGADASRLKIVPNSIVLPHPLPAQQIGEWRKRYGLKKFLLSVGRLDRVKRGDFLVRALPSLPRDISLVFIGPDAGCRDEWRQLAEKLDLGKAVHFFGEVSDYDLKAAYQACSALVLASKYEGLPTVILEAMALGAPVVASATGGTTCLIKHGVNGFLFSYDDTAEFGAAVQSALASETAAIAARARNMVASEYSWTANIPRICSLYAEPTDVRAGEECAIA